MLMLKFIYKLNTINNINLNFGPQHPAAHGVLRLILQVNNEKIIKCDPHIGLLHRGSENLVCSKPYYLSLPYFDRLDYVSMLSQEHSYCLVIEKILNTYKVNILSKQIRTMLDELTRVLNHLLAIACHALDVGSMSPIFWTFEERENIMNIYESFSGARMHAAYYRPDTNLNLLYKTTEQKIIDFLKKFNHTVNEVNSILINNKIWLSRLTNVGLVSTKMVYTFSLSGVLLRSTGIKKDIRLDNSYSYYKFINFNSYVSNNGDCMDRYVIRMYEMLESSSIMSSIINKINFKKKYNFNNNYNKMESTINKFRLWSNLNKLNYNNKTVPIESPKGLFSVTLVSNESNTPIKCKVKSPSYNNLFLLKSLSKNLLIADLITLIGTSDIVFGEIDR